MFSKLNEWDTITEEDTQVLESFVCNMYGQKRFRSIDDLRLELFLKKYKPNNDSLGDNVRKLDAASLPPCSRVLLKKLKRSSYIARLWRNCFNADPQDQDVLSFGWRMEDGHYNIQWFDGDAAPKIVDVVRQFEGTLFKILKIPNELITKSILFISFCFARKGHLTKTNFFQVENSELKDESI